jgi:hypothetical protein
MIVPISGPDVDVAQSNIVAAAVVAGDGKYNLDRLGTAWKQVAQSE